MTKYQSISLLAITLGFLILTLGISPVMGKDLRDWGNKIDNVSKRFQTLNKFNDEAVLDKETQLVWERTPQSFPATWDLARHFCANKKSGGRMGWRLPSVSELASLIDTNNSDPALPIGHPFNSVFSTEYWTANENLLDASKAWTVDLDRGFVSENSEKPFHINRQYWCVRGPSPGTNPY